MRKNSPRKWLHACLDLLPVILIPVFMVYSHRHDVTENVQITYKYESNEVNTLDDLVIGNIYNLSLENSYIDDFLLSSGNFIYFELLSNLNLEFNVSYDDFVGFDIIKPNTYIAFSNTNNISYIEFYEDNTFIEYYNSFTFSGKILNNFNFVYYGGNFSGYELITYTDYNVIESVDTSNTNVMDSFMNNFNNTIQTHFNMGNVFNLGDVYQWFNINIFGGNAPVIIQSIYNIVIYELVMDLLFLLYGLFMWFIDIIQHLMDKPFKSVK